VTAGTIVVRSIFNSWLVRAICVGRNGSGEDDTATSFSSGLAQVQAFLDRASFSVITVCMPCIDDFFNHFSAPSDASFSIGTPSVMTQYFEGFDRLLLRLIPITLCYAIFYHRKLVITLDPIDAVIKVQKHLDLHIWRR
jgi:hypothetical protein